jgi:Tol biopolymer transport system component
MAAGPSRTPRENSRDARRRQAAKCGTRHQCTAVPFNTAGCRRAERVQAFVELLPNTVVGPLNDLPGNAATPPPAGPSDGRLDSWKKIASYLKRDVSTVQRWERREAMPVHRHLHDKQGSVFAFRAELDAWWLSRSAQLAGEANAATEAPPSTGIATESASATATDSGMPAADRGRHRWLLPSVSTILLACIGLVFWALHRTEASWRNPLENAQFHALTDFGGGESAAAISRDGSRVAFLSDRDGPVDVWLTDVGSGRFTNLTHGAFGGLVNPVVRTLGFSPDAALVTMWSRERDGSKPQDINLWAAPVVGGAVELYLRGVAELDWSNDGRLVYHTTAPGDPIFVRERGQGATRQIYVAPAGVHCHFPVWSPDSAFIYFVRGVPPDDWDVWRIRPDGQALERITSLGTRVTHPVFLDERTLLYLATDRDGSGPWLFAIDLQRHSTHRLTTGIERYTSLAANQDASRLVVTVATSTSTLWRVPIAAQAPAESGPTRIAVPGSHVNAPRFAAGALYYVNSEAGRQGIWRWAKGSAAQVWSDPHARIAAPPAISPDGRKLAVIAETNGRKRLLVMGTDGAGLRELAANLELQGSPAWAPDGSSLVAAVTRSGTPRIFRFPASGGAPALLVSEYSSDPVWSSDGEFLVYSGPDVGTSFPLRAAAADGRAREFPNLMLTRGARRIGFLPGSHKLVILRGEIENKNFWLIDLDNGTERLLTSLPRDVLVGDFDISDDGSEIVFDRTRETSDVMAIDRARD